MPGPLAAAGLMAGGQILGGIFGASAQRNANRTNLRIAREQMAFQEGQTARQMEFQERMSSTAHQRETKDLLAAGLNPMLAYAKGSGGASSPVGAAASGQTARVEPVNYGSGISSAANVLRNYFEMRQMKAAAETAEHGAVSAGAKAETDKIDLDITKQTQALRFGAARADYQRRVDEGEIVMYNRLQAKKFFEQYDERIKQELISITSGAERSRLLVEYQKLQNQLSSFDVPRAEAFAEFWKTQVAKASPALRWAFWIAYMGSGLASRVSRIGP